MNHAIPLNQDRLPEAIQACVWGVEAGGKMLVLQDEETDRSNLQNRLSFKLYEQINKVGKMTNAREFCKYKFGMPILIADDPKMMRRFKLIFERLGYTSRLEAIEIIPVTSLMKVKQMSLYLESIYNHFDPLGYDLPRPDDLYWAALGYKRGESNGE